MEEFDPIDPQLKNLDFERPNKNLQWWGDPILTESPKDRLRAEKLSKKIKEAFIIKVLEIRKKKSLVPNLSDVIKQSIQRQQTIKSEFVYRRNRQNFSIEEFINKLDQDQNMKKSQYKELKEHMKSIEKEIESRSRGLKILSGKMNHLLRPVEKYGSLSNTQPTMMLV